LGEVVRCPTRNWSYGLGRWNRPEEINRGA
jgi:hypothetical protein